MSVNETNHQHTKQVLDCFVDARCSVPFTPIGCFNDKQQEHGRPLPELLITDRDVKSPKFSGIKVNWGQWDKYLNDIVCRCAAKAKEKKYSLFGVQNYGEIIYTVHLLPPATYLLQIQPLLTLRSTLYV